MDGKKYFRDCCKSNNLECDKYFILGTGLKRTPKKQRFEYRIDPCKRTSTQIFAIKYFEEDNFYLAWDLRAKKARGKSVFSVACSDIEELHCLGGLDRTTKAVEYSGWGEEPVYIFQPNTVNVFLKEVAFHDVKEVEIR